MRDRSGLAAASGPNLLGKACNTTIIDRSKTLARRPQPALSPEDSGNKKAALRSGSQVTTRGALLAADLEQIADFWSLKDGICFLPERMQARTVLQQCCIQFA